MPDDLSERLECASYTHARRHPIVIGQIAGWSPPFQLTITQIGVLILGFLLLFRTWGLWAGFLPRQMAVLVSIGVPCVAAWLVRQVRVEGRSIARAGVGFLSLLLSPSAGANGGRRHQLGRAADLRNNAVYLHHGNQTR